MDTYSGESPLNFLNENPCDVTDYLYDDTETQEIQDVNDVSMTLPHMICIPPTETSQTTQKVTTSNQSLHKKQILPDQGYDTSDGSPPNKRQCQSKNTEQLFSLSPSMSPTPLTPPTTLSLYDSFQSPQLPVQQQYLLQQQAQPLVQFSQTAEPTFSQLLTNMISFPLLFIQQQVQQQQQQQQAQLQQVQQQVQQQQAQRQVQQQQAQQQVQQQIQQQQIQQQVQQQQAQQQLQQQIQQRHQQQVQQQQIQQQAQQQVQQQQAQQQVQQQIQQQVQQQVQQPQFQQQVQHQQMVQQTAPHLQQPDEMELKKYFEDENAVNFLLNPFMIQDDSFFIKEFLKRMNIDLPMTRSDFNNLSILMASETSSPHNVSITLQQLKNFLLRFGPLSQTLEKIRDFVNAGAVNWFHGNITREKAVELLKISFNNEKCTHFLLRSVPIQIFRGSNFYVFAVSYINTNEEVCHIRAFTDKQGRFCVQKIPNVIEGTVQKYDFKSYLQKLEPSSFCKPVSCSDFASLHNREFLSEQDTKNGYVLS